MSFATIFQLSFFLVAPFWLLMILAPHWRWTKRIIKSPWIAAPAALLYTVLVVPGIADVFSSVSNPDLAGVAALWVLKQVPLSAGCISWLLICS